MYANINKMNLSNDCIFSYELTSLLADMNRDNTHTYFIANTDKNINMDNMNNVVNILCYMNDIKDKLDISELYVN